MDDLYTIKQAAEIVGASRQVLRLYCARYARWLSTYATPDPGRERRVTRTDLRVFRFIYELTDTGLTHTEVLERLQAGALDDFAWEPPETPQGAATGPTEANSMMLVPMERLQAAQALLADAQRREQEAVAKAEAAQAEVLRLAGELGEARGALAVYERRKRPKWLAALFGE